MEILHTFDDRNYDSEWPRQHRMAARAVILRAGRAAMVMSAKEGYYKFPGGGVEPGESPDEALARETMEEAGMRVIPSSIRPLGILREVRRSQRGEEIFQHDSLYYFADVEEERFELRLDDYEADLMYHPVWVDLRTAYEANVRPEICRRSRFLVREAYLLRLLMDRKESAP